MSLDSSLILNNENKTVAQNLALRAAQVALNNFEWRFVTLVLQNSSILIGLSAFMQFYRKSVIVGTGSLDFDETTRQQIKQFVVFGSDLINIINMLHWMQYKNFDNTGKFIVICKNCDERETMNTFWKHKIINVVFINNSSRADTIGFTFSVYDNEECGISPPQALLGACSYNSCTKVFRTKLVNFNTCPIIVSTFEQMPFMILKSGTSKGSDGDLLVLIAETLNATLKVITPHRGFGWGALAKDGNWSGSLADVYYDLANFSMTSPCITLTRLRDFHISTDYHMINMVWVTHPPIPLPAWHKLVRPFKINARICLAVTFVFVVLVALFVKKNYWIKFNNRISPMGRPHSSLLFNSWTICMGLPMTSLPSKPAFMTLFMLWAYYCFMIRTFYQTTLINSMKNNLTHLEFENLEDILSSGYRFGGTPSFKEFFSNTPEVYNHWTPIDYTNRVEVAIDISKGMKFALVMKKVTAQYVLAKKYVKLHIVPQVIVTSPTVLYFKKFSPMVESVNHVLERLKEGGFTHKLYRDYTSVQPNEKKESTVSMNIGHYMGCYVILTAGWFASVIIFFCEICYKYIVKQSHKKW